MNTLHLNGVEVCTSYLTQRSYRAAYCELLVCVTPENLDQALKAFEENATQFSGLRVVGIADLSFLATFPDLRYLEVTDQPRVNTRHLDGLTNLRGLRLESPAAGIDFSCFPELEVFVGDWHSGNSNIHRCDELRQLRIWQFKPKSLDLASIANVTRLEWLAITQTNIESLDGLETFEDLRYFDIAYARQLASLDAFGTPSCEVRELEIQNAKKIQSYEPLASLTRLRRLKLSACAPISHLGWVSTMESLDFFSFVETNIEDGDLSPLLELPRLRYVGTMDKKHYNYKCDALNELLEERAAAAPARDDR